MDPDPHLMHRLYQGRLEPGEHVVVPMLTGSMAPVVPAGSRIEVVRPEPADLVAGQVVVFRDGQKLVAHRLLFGCPLPAPGWFLQRGDGVSKAGLVSARDIVGLVVAVHDDVDRLDLTTPAARHQGRLRARRSLHRLPAAWLARLVGRTAS